MSGKNPESDGVKEVPIDLLEVHREAVAKAGPPARELASINAQMFAGQIAQVSLIRELKLLELDEADLTQCPSAHAVQNVEIGNDIAA